MHASAGGERASKLGGLLGDLLGNLESLKEILAPETLDAAKTVVMNVAKVHAYDGPKKARALITNACNLLNTDLVEQIKELLKELGPLCCIPMFDSRIGAY
ncbi:hypothetical protein EMCG_09766 [[Emmonsia] crescens]|uniref:Uncharacterized protein n=1 Tax=[Emmonsia] crescens TaxID=73230 RepID=A0A0G2I260_9EURO|nr:hypothetical protein EMCG_09766 [Emmonsia crescens UAMH 3008]